MAEHKGDNSTISLVEETTYAQPPVSYDGTGKMMQNNDGTFNATRNTLESEARTPDSELSGVRLGNKNVGATFPVNIDPKNYNKLFESLFYGRFTSGGTPAVKAGNSVTATKKFELVVPMTSAKQTALPAVVGNAYLLDFSEAGLSHLNGVAILVEKDSTELKFLHPNQREDTVPSTSSDTTVTAIPNLRPAKQRLSFNAEETIFPEDGSTPSRFMTTGAITTGASIDLPSEGIVKSSFSMIGSNQIASKQYDSFDSNLTNQQEAHKNVVAHEKYEPIVLQDSAILNDDASILCEWLSGSINIENGTQNFFTGCSYGARGSFSGSFRVNISYEALFESEDDFIAFEQEQSTKMFLRLKDRNSDQCLTLYIPQMFKTGFERTGGKGLVSASITAVAVVSEEALNSIILASHSV